MTGGEIDLLAEDRRANLVVIEVRGKARANYLPRHTLAPAKIARLRRMAIRLSLRYRRKVRMEFLEVVGELPRNTLFTEWALAWWPEALGLRLTVFRLEEN